MRLQFDPERPIYQQIIDEFKRAVARGELAPGDKIPSQRDLATEARVNPNTVQRAYREMEWLGLTETVRGQGTFVADRPELLQGLRQDMARDALDRFVKEMSALGFDGETIVGLTVEAVRSFANASGQGGGENSGGDGGGGNAGRGEHGSGGIAERGGHGGRGETTGGGANG